MNAQDYSVVAGLASSAGLLDRGSCTEHALLDDSDAVAVDLRGAQRIDTQTLGEPCAALRTISRHGLKLAIVGADQRVRWALALYEIGGRAFHPTLESALARSHCGSIHAEPSPPSRRDPLV